ncbi:MAG: hypothetical protein U1E87_10560 [Alphaproteobacteria bacterium]
MNAIRLVPLWAGLLIASVHAGAPYEERMGGGQGWRPVPIESRSDGTAAFQAGRFATAVRLLRPYAEAGDADAQLKLGSILGGLGELGVGAERVTKDPPAAAKWLGRAAEGGNAEAMRDYARLAELGEGMARDPVTAFRCYAAAAAKLPGGREKLRRSRAPYASSRTPSVSLRNSRGRPPGEILAEAVAKTEELAQAARGQGVSGATSPKLRR